MTAVKSRFHWAVVLFLLGMVVLTGFLMPTFPFGSDEGDNILGAQSVLRGGDIYAAFYSQHMPFGYYFTAGLAMCGAKSVPEFRMAYVVFLAFFWAWLYWSYAQRVPPVMLMFLVIAFPLSAPYFLGHVILADNLSALALLVLILELISYQGPGDLRPGRMAIISLASFTAINSSFLSIYPVFVFFAGMAISDLQRGRWRIADFPFRRYLLLASATALPFALLIGWYALTGNLGRFYYQAYEFNRTVYAKYVWVRAQPSLFTAFVYLPLVWIQHVLSAVKLAVQNATISLDLLLALSNLALIFFLRRGWVLSVTLFLFLVYTGTRSFGGCGYTGFHSATYFMLSLAALGWLMAALSRQSHRAKILGIACLLVIFLRCTVPLYLRVALPVYWRHLRCDPELFDLEPRFATIYDKEVKALTKPGDKIWSAGVDGYIYINNRCRPAGRIWGLVPWFADNYTDEIIADLEKHQPKLIVFPSEGEVWGHALKDFGKVVFQYIQAHYLPLDVNAPIRKDIYILKNLPP